jgi:hypothetical protein
MMEDDYGKLKKFFKNLAREKTVQVFFRSIDFATLLSNMD